LYTRARARAGRAGRLIVAALSPRHPYRIRPARGRRMGGDEGTREAAGAKQREAERLRLEAERTLAGAEQAEESAQRAEQRSHAERSEAERLRREAETHQARAENFARFPRMSRSGPANSEPPPRRLPAKLSQLIRTLPIRARTSTSRRSCGAKSQRKIGDRNFCPMIFPKIGGTSRRPSASPGLRRNDCSAVGRAAQGHGLTINTGLE
jgi:hypothetical protein